MSVPAPTLAHDKANTVTHDHHGFRYEYALDADGDLITRSKKPGDGYGFNVWEKCLPQDGPVTCTDEWSDAYGEVAEVDPTREAYIAALKLMLTTTRDSAAS